MGDTGEVEGRAVAHTQFLLSSRRLVRLEAKSSAASSPPPRDLEVPAKRRGDGVGPNHPEEHLLRLGPGGGQLNSVRVRVRAGGTPQHASVVIGGLSSGIGFRRSGLGPGRYWRRSEFGGACRWGGPGPDSQSCASGRRRQICGAPPLSLLHAEKGLISSMLAAARAMTDSGEFGQDLCDLGQFRASLANSGADSTTFEGIARN